MRTTATLFQRNVWKEDIYLIGFRRESGSKRGSFTLRMPSKYIWVDIAPKREKIAEK